MLQRARIPAAVLLGFVLLVLFSPPTGFAPTRVAVSEGESAAQIGSQLKVAHVISYARLLSTLLRISEQDNAIHAGEYYFDKPEGTLFVLHRLVTAEYGIAQMRITFQEGTTNREAAQLVSKEFSGISEQTFISAAGGQEGYLFPDTYFFPPSSTAESIVKTMRDNFEVKIAPLTGDVANSGHSLADIITMASLVEKEARTTENRHIVAGILWNRISKGMPLQVDAVFGYINNRDTYSPSLSDLKIDSPYNTYLHKGLPPGPIDNPGLDAIDAALHPTKTKYLYYLTGSDNLMHYATTLAGHIANQQKYLK